MHDVGFFVMRKACNVATSIWVTQAVIKQRGVQLPGVLTLLFTDHVVVFEVLTAFFLRDAAIFFYICFLQKGMLVFLWWLVLSEAPLCKDNKWVMRPDILPGNVLRTKEASGSSKSAFKVRCFLYVCVYIYIRVFGQRRQEPKDAYAEWNCTTWSCSMLYCIPILSDSLKACCRLWKWKSEL